MSIFSISKARAPMQALLSDMQPKQRIQRALSTPPWLSPTMEFDYGIWLGVSAMRSTDGRQLGESNTRPFAYQKPVPTKWTECHFADSRKGGMMNITALKILMENFDGAVSLLLQVRQHYLNYIDSPQRPLGLWDIYLMSRAALGIITYLARRSPPGVTDNHITPLLASHYKLVSGLFITVRDMIAKADHSVLENQLFSTEEFIAYADKQHMFTSADGRVCAGSQKKISEFVQYALYGQNAQPYKNGVQLSQMVTDINHWLDYIFLATELELYVEYEAAGAHRHELDIPTDATRIETLPTEQAVITELLRKKCAHILQINTNYNIAPPEQDTMPGTARLGHDQTCHRIGRIGAEKQNQILKHLGYKKKITLKKRQVIKRCPQL